MFGRLAFHLFLAVVQPTPDAVIDLGTAGGVRMVEGQWRYSDTKIVEVDFRGPGPDGQPTGGPVKTYDYTPHAGGADFDDSKWEVLDPASLSKRRAAGRICFNWYRINVTIPRRIESFDPAGSTVTFETSVDDYAEVWVNGELVRGLGQMGGSVVAGWNAPNRLVIGRNVRPGQKIQLAVFGMNGPISNPPTNFIFMRYARLEFHRNGPAPVAIAPSEVNVQVVRLDPAMDGIVGPNPKIFKLAEGFQFTEGPVWVPRDGGYLLFSDPNANTIYKYTKGGRLSVYRQPSGYAGADIAEYGQPGSNGLALDPLGRLTVNEHGNRRVTRTEADGSITVLAGRYQGKRLNSPNDLVYRSDGTLYFTDPPFGLPKFFDDPRKELSFSGVYSIHKGQLRLVASDFTGPNGLAFSPDERYLYVGNWDEKKKVVMRYEARPDGALANGSVFFDMTSAPGEDAIDGIKVDQRGNVYVSGPGGLWVISAEGKHLGTIVAPRHIHNMAWGDDGKTLYLCARDNLYRMPLRVSGWPLEKIADGFTWVEGPVWDGQTGSLLFSDIPANAVYRWQEGKGASQFLKPSGYSGATPFTGREPGSNGLAFDPQGRLVLCQHGDRRIVRVEPDGTRTVLVDRYQGKRLNSPNDLVFRSNGDLYFTDPPFGLPGVFDDPQKELPFSGVYKLSKEGALTLLSSDFRAPNGIAFSPDEKTLYVTDVDPERPAWWAFDVRPDGTLANRRLFHDASRWKAPNFGGPDGLKVDRQGNLFAARPGGLNVFAPDGTLLRTIETGIATSNCAWGENDSVLYITASTGIYRIRFPTKGL
jgi:gluconolactonase